MNRIVWVNKFKGNTVVRLACFPLMNIKRAIGIRRYAKSSDSQAYLALKNTYKDQRCFVVANGPSLTTDDLDLLRNEITFGVNAIYQLFHKTEWRPSFYFCANKRAWRDGNYCDYFAKNDYSGIMFLDNEIAKVPENQNIIRFISKTCFYLKRSNIGRLKKTAVANHRVPGVFLELPSVVYPAILTAIHMGFSKIYLIGQDCNYGRQKVDYPEGFELKRNDICFDNSMQLLFQGFSNIKEYAEARGVQIINATRGGELEVFERVDLDEVLASSN